MDEKLGSEPLSIRHVFVKVRTTYELSGHCRMRFHRTFLVRHDLAAGATLKICIVYQKPEPVPVPMLRHALTNE